MKSKRGQLLHLRLFIAGGNRLSILALANLKRILASLREKDYRLETIDVLQEPLKALEEQIFVTPTLDKISPPPRERIIGDLSDYEKVISVLKKDDSEELQ